MQHEKCLPSVTEKVWTTSLPEDGQLRPKHVAVFKKLGLTKVIVLKFSKF